MNRSKLFNYTIILFICMADVFMFQHHHVTEEFALAGAFLNLLWGLALNE